MIICTNCNHENPEGSVQCENCYAPLPQTSSCPNCGAFTQINAAFCGQCGYNLLSEEPLSLIESEELSKRNIPEKDTISLKEEDLVVTDVWESEVAEPQDSFAISSSEWATEARISDSSSFPAEIADEAETVENLAEPEELALTSNSDYDVLESDEDIDLDTNLDLALEEELPEMSDIEELEETTARVLSDLSPLAEPAPAPEPEIEMADEVELEELALTSNSDYDVWESDEDIDLNTNLDLALEEELPEMSDIEELEETKSRFLSDLSPLAEPEPVPESEIDSPDLDLTSETEEIPEVSTSAVPERSPVSWSKPINRVTESATQLQLERIILSHVQTGTDIELAQNLDIIRIGKPNNQIPPDIDVSGFPDANIVSRVHANIRVEGDSYFIEDAGSSNGTYINHKPLLTGNRHRLRFGDRISLGKGDLMTFIFKIIDD